MKAFFVYFYLVITLVICFAFISDVGIFFLVKTFLPGRAGGHGFVSEVRVVSYNED